MKRISSALGIVSLVRAVRARDIHNQAERSFTLGIFGREDLVSELATALGGSKLAGPQETGYLRTGPRVSLNPETLSSLSAALVVSDGTPADEQLASVVAGPRVPVPMLVLQRESPATDTQRLSLTAKRDPFLKHATVPDFSSAKALEAVAQFLAMVPELRLAIGRRLAGLRGPLARQIIAETSKANAEVAALSNIPDFIPIIGNFVGTAAEFVVLTKTQITMVYSLAELYDRDVRKRYKVLMEIMPVVGSAFVWRTVARELVGLVPLFLGAIPKIAIAYAGTFVVGQSAAYYYNEGRKPPRELVRSFYETAVARTKSLRIFGFPRKETKETAVPEPALQAVASE
jgi:uncharacterized protein (DUF697 family)